MESSIKYFQIIIVRVIQLLSTQRCLGKVYVLLSAYCKIRHRVLMGDSLSSDLQNIHSNINDINLEIEESTYSLSILSFTLTFT